MTREEILSEIEGVLEVGEGMNLRIALRHAEAYIKNTEPRLMSIDEVKDADFAWYDYPETGYTTPVIHCRKILYPAEEYGESWRCWTKKPTQEQREAEKWRDSAT